MLYSDPSIVNTLLGKCLVAIAEGPGAQLFMLLMGVNFTFRKKHSNKQILIRSAKLIAAGYILNILKFSIPYNLELLPEKLLQDLAVNKSNALQSLTGIGDILHFASFALVILHLVYKHNHYHTLAICLAIIITFSSPYLWDLHTGNSNLDYLLSLANGQPPKVFFPLLPWLVYPIFGLYIGHCLQKAHERTINYCGIFGAVMLITGLTFDQLYPVHYAAGFYRTGPAATIWHTGIVLITLFAWQLISHQFKTNLFFRLLNYSSRNITILYFIQWVIILWLLPIFGYHTLNTTSSIYVMLAISINTYLLTFSFQLLKQHYARTRNL
jgi:hypothetical protein